MDGSGLATQAVVDALVEAASGREKSFQDVFEAILNSGAGGRGWAREVKFNLIDPTTGDLLRNADGSLIEGQADFMRNNNGQLELLELKTKTGALRRNQEVYMDLIESGDAEVRIVNDAKARKLGMGKASAARGGSVLARMHVLRPDVVRQLLTDPKVAVASVARHLREITGRQLFRTVRIPKGVSVHGKRSRYVAREGGSIAMGLLEVENLVSDYLLSSKEETLLTIQAKGARFGYDAVTADEHRFVAGMGYELTREKGIAWGCGDPDDLHFIPGYGSALGQGTEVLKVQPARNVTGAINTVKDFVLTLTGGPPPRQEVEVVGRGT